MSGVPSSSRRPHSVVQQESKSSAKTISSETSYKPSWRTETSYKPSWHIEVSYKLSDEATAGGASVVASSQHTDPNGRSFGRTDRWATSKELGSHNSDRGNAQRSLKYSSTASRAEDSERIISELRREIRNLRQEARGRSPAKERPRNRMAEAFVSRFITNSRKTKEMDALLTMKLEDNETIKEYPTRFWETYNDIDGCDEEVEEDGGGTISAQTVAQPKVITPKPSTRSKNNAKSLSTLSNFVAPTFRAFETVFKEPIYKLLEKIKREPFFVWPPKLLENPVLRNEKLYCTYHKDTEGTHRLGELCRGDVSGSIHEAWLGRSRPDQFYIPHIRLLWGANCVAWEDSPTCSSRTFSLGQFMTLLGYLLTWHVISSIFRPNTNRIAQKRQKLAPERAAIVLEEVERLLESGAIQEVQYPVWLVIKHGGGQKEEWKMESLYRFY
uniref:Retrotransposon gag domain-containing protein n=1 Tax=Fagus sylvatica TaxID=28930 RepID=A0A2N9FUK8_FAGSY